jgi:serine/threonine protein kinase
MMDHPNIARCFDAGATQLGRPFFVMELVRGIKITDYLRSGQLCPRRSGSIFSFRPATPSSTRTRKGIIHRDIKPPTSCVTLHDGVPVPKVIDFGVAKAPSPAAHRSDFLHPNSSK